MNEVISDEEATVELIQIQNKYADDTESRHVMEDKFVSELLSKLGYTSVAEQYMKTEKWY